jgi:hypothetical protein
MAGVSKRLLRPTSQNGLGQGKIELVRLTPGTPPVNPWDPPTAPTLTKTTLNGAATGVGKELVGTPVAVGNAIVATDLSVIVAPWGGAYDPADKLELDGKPVTILKVENIPAVGTVSAIRFIVRG